MENPGPRWLFLERGQFETPWGHTSYTRECTSKERKDTNTPLLRAYRQKCPHVVEKIIPAGRTTPDIVIPAITYVHTIRVLYRHAYDFRM